MTMRCSASARACVIAGLVGLVSLANSSAVSAQLNAPVQSGADPETATIGGTVVDATRAVVPGVRIMVINNATATTRETTTGATGEFVVAGLPPGTYTLRGSLEGFAPIEVRDLVARSGERRDVALSLEAAGVTESVEIVSKIKEAAIRVPVMVSDVTHEDLQRSVPLSLEDTIRPIAGLQFGTQANVFSRIETRGLRTTDDVLVLLDGVPYRQVNGSADITMIPPEVVQAVELEKGPASSIYGRSAVGGVVSFSTIPDSSKTPTADLSETVASWNTFDTQGSLQLPWSATNRLSANGLLSRSDWYQRKTGRDADFFTVAEQWNPSTVWATKAQYLFSKLHAGRGSIIPLQNGRPLFGITSEDNFAVPGVHYDGGLNSFTLRTDTSLGRWGFLTNSANVNHFTRWYDGGVTIVPPPIVQSKQYSIDNTRQNAFVDDVVIRRDADFGSTRTTLLVGGTVEIGTWNTNEPNSLLNQPLFKGPDYTTPVPGPAAGNDPRGTPGPIVNSDYRQNIESVYVQERVDRGRITGVLGARADRFDQRLTQSNTGVVSAQTRSRLTPRIGLDVQGVQNSTVEIAFFGNWVEGFKPLFPSLSTLAGVTIPVLLRPELTHSLEGGVKLRAAQGHLSGQVSVFDEEKVDAQRNFRPDPNSLLATNATFYVHGLEGELRSQVSRRHLLYANYAYHDARYTNFNPTPTSSFTGYRLHMSAKNIWGAGYTLLVGPVNWTSGISFVGARPLRDSIVNPQILPSYTTLNSSVGVNVSSRVRVVVSGTNLTNEFYIADDFSANDSGCPGQPRRVALMARYRF